MKCGDCGATVTPEARYCHHCGVPLKAGYSTARKLPPFHRPDKPLSIKPLSPSNQSDSPTTTPSATPSAHASGSAPAVTTYVATPPIATAGAAPSLASSEAREACSEPLLHAHAAPTPGAAQSTADTLSCEQVAGYDIMARFHATPGAPESPAPPSPLLAEPDDLALQPEEDEKDLPINDLEHMAAACGDAIRELPKKEFAIGFGYGVRSAHPTAAGEVHGGAPAKLAHATGAEAARRIGLAQRSQRSFQYGLAEVAWYETNGVLGRVLAVLLCANLTWILWSPYSPTGAKNLAAWQGATDAALSLTWLPEPVREVLRDPLRRVAGHDISASPIGSNEASGDMGRLAISLLPGMAAALLLALACLRVLDGGLERARTWCTFLQSLAAAGCAVLTGLWAWRVVAAQFEALGALYGRPEGLLELLGASHLWFIPLLGAAAAASLFAPLVRRWIPFAYVAVGLLTALASAPAVRRLLASPESESLFAHTAPLIILGLAMWRWRPPSAEER